MDISESRTEAKILWTSSSVEGLVAAQRSTDRKMSTSGAQNESLEMSNYGQAWTNTTGKTVRSGFSVKSHEELGDRVMAYSFVKRDNSYYLLKVSAFPWHIISIVDSLNVMNGNADGPIRK